MIEYVYGVDVAVNRVLFARSLLAPEWGRMSAATAMSFITLGAAYVLWAWRGADLVLQIAALLVGLLAVMGLVGFGYGTRYYTLGPLWSYGLHTAMGFLFLSLGVLALRPERGLMAVVSADTVGGMLARRLLPAGILVPSVLGWLRLVGEEAGLYPTTFGTAFHVGANIVVLVAVVMWVARTLSLADLRRRVAEQQLQQTMLRLHHSEQRLRANFDNAALGIIEVDTEDRAVDVNERICQILGYAREELVGKSVHELTYPEDQPRSDRLNAETHEGASQRVDYEKRYLKRDGSPVWVHVTVSSIRDASGQHLRSIGTVEDISQRKHAEDRNRQLNEDLEKRNAALDAERARWRGVVARRS
jgi:PAS domain S-box-containing protein